MINLYERDGKREHIKHAEKFAAILGCELVQRDISSILQASESYSLLPIHLVPFRSWRRKLVEFARDRILKRDQHDLLETRFKAEDGSWEAKGNAYAMAKHRLRMLLSFQYAEVHNLMVIGAANRTEWLTGTFSKFGVDHCADIMPILHLYRSEVEELAEALEIPIFIREKAADPDILPGLDDKQELLGDFRTVDRILAMLEKGERLDEGMFDMKLVEKIKELMKLSEPMREAPYTLERNE